MFKIELYNAIWLFAIIFMLHDFEEIISVENWARRMEDKVKNGNSKINKLTWDFWNVNSYSFAKRDVFIFLTMSVITFLKVQYIENTWIAGLFLAFLIFVLLHNVAHAVQTLFMKAYTPGLYTSIILVTPYTIYLLFRI
jgi:hypothetical protein